MSQRGRTSGDYRNILVNIQIVNINPPQSNPQLNPPSNVTPNHKIVTLYGDNPLLIASGYMQYVYDEQRKKYLDGFGGNLSLLKLINDMDLNLKFMLRSKIIDDSNSMYINTMSFCILKVIIISM
jgi:hypothetical protein